MRYWIFEDNRVLGPYELAQLAANPSFGPETLVCPEERRGVSIDDWQRASTLPELSEILAQVQSRDPKKASRPPAETSAAPAAQDSAASTELREKIAKLEEAVLQLQQVKHDVAAQGVALCELTREIEGLRAQKGEQAGQVVDLSIPLPPVVSLPAPEPASVKQKKPLLIGVLIGLPALGLIVLILGRGGKKSSLPKAPMAPAIAPTPAPIPISTAAAVSPVAVNPREAAIALAKSWSIPDGRTLGQALETLSPPVGNLSPWMAEPLPDGRVSVNYFARGGASGTPTIVYEFEVDLSSKVLSGHNAPAQTVLGQSPPPPAEAKPLAIKIKNKPRGRKRKKKTLDSLLLGSMSGKNSEETSRTEASLAEPAARTGKQPSKAQTDDVLK